MIGILRHWFGLWWCSYGMHSTGTQRHGYCRRCSLWVSE